MSHRSPDGKEGEEVRTHRLGPVRRLEALSTDWSGLDGLSPSDLDSNFIEAVGKRAEDQERPLLESLFE